MAFFDANIVPVGGVKPQNDYFAPSNWITRLNDSYRGIQTINDQSASSVDNNDDLLDPSGTAQANWEYEKQLELLAEQRAFNSAEAQKNRDWQERLSNSAYQRAVEDLEAAGLNKWLAVTGGNGASASTPSGSSATSSAGDASAPNPGIYKALLQFYSQLASSAIKIIDFF